LTPEKAVFGYAMAFIIGGFVAGMIAGEIRKQVEAALREADTRRQLESVEHDLSLARSIQQSLLSNMTPEIEGFEIAGWNRPGIRRVEATTTGRFFRMGPGWWNWPT
jgi:hypothetical protein